MFDLDVQGNCTCALPVGLSAYIAAEFISSFPLQHMQPTSEPFKHKGNLDTQNEQLTHKRPITSAQHSSNSSSSQRLAEPSPGPSSLPHGDSSRKMQVGVHANAAWQPAAELPGCGPLLPSWRQLTDLLVPLLHNVRACCASPTLAAPFSVVPVPNSVYAALFHSCWSDL